MLAAVEGPAPVISLDKIRKIFANVDTIMGLNTFLFDSLEARVNDWSPSQMIGDLFLEMVFSPASFFFSFLFLLVLFLLFLINTFAESLFKSLRIVL